MPPRHDGGLLQDAWEKLTPETSASIPTRVARWCTDILRPSFLTRGPRKQIGPTSYLDGLRGFAAFLVYWQHHQIWAHLSEHIFENAYGYEGRYYFVALPGVRTFFNGGHFAVAVFFVISGHVLSTKPVVYIYSRDYEKLQDNLASALFRRWPRLFIPLICTTFAYITSWHLFGIWTAYPDHEPTYFEEVRKWYWEFANFSFIHRTKGAPWLNTNFHLWSIPIEFQGSVVIYTTHLALSRCRRNPRLYFEVGLICYFLFIVDGWFCSMFLAGMLLCDLDQLRRNDDLPSVFSMLAPYKRVIYYTLFILGVYLGGVPASGPNLEMLRASPGWYYLSFLKSQSLWDYKWFYLFWAATFVVASIPHIDWLKNFFETRFCQYLGRISFALYLVHGPVLWTLSDRIYAAVGWTRDFKTDGLVAWNDLFPLSKSGPLGLELAFWLPHLIILPVTLWVAEVVTRLFDEPSVRFSHWLYRKTRAAKV